MIMMSGRGSLRGDEAGLRSGGVGGRGDSRGGHFISHSFSKLLFSTFEDDRAQSKEIARTEQRDEAKVEDLTNLQPRIRRDRKDSGSGALDPAFGSAVAARAK